MSSEDKKEYNLFNGRRTADQYVKGYLKGIAGIAGLTLLIVLPISYWAVKQIIEHDNRILAIETSRFTVEDGLDLVKSIHEVQLGILSVQKEFESQSEDLDEIKVLLRRAAPYEIRND